MGADDFHSSTMSRMRSSFAGPSVQSVKRCPSS